MRVFGAFIRDESGVTAIEYGMIAGAVAIVIIPVLGSIGSKLSLVFRLISSKLS